MPRRTCSKKPSKSDTREIIMHTNSIDLSSDFEFLNGSISTSDVHMHFLLFGRITNSSFSNLYKRSAEIGWKQILIDERNSLRLDEKSRLKRLLLNRLIHECSENPIDFKRKANELHIELQNQMSDLNDPEEVHYHHLQSINAVYDEVKAWRVIQCRRRLFDKVYDRQCNLLVLQRLITDRFIFLVESAYHDPEALRQLFEYSLIIVVQPSGTDCVAVTTYEKAGNHSIAKLKTRIICLLDPDRVQQYFKLPNIKMTLFPEDRTIDPDGDIQAPLEWKTRTIITKENTARTFYYAELEEKNSIILTKLSDNRKPLYNNGLCQLQFQTTFQMMSSDVHITFTSELFGLCSHPNFSPKHLTKVFLTEVNEMYPDINLDTHIDTLNGYICELHRRIAGVEAKAHTQEFIHDNLMKIYQLFAQSAASPDGPVAFFQLTIYEKFLKNLFTQIKFLGKYPFLAMMYHDSLFRGICSETIDRTIADDMRGGALMVLRFEEATEKENVEQTTIILTAINRTLCKSCILPKYVMDDICKCCYTAGENIETHFEIYDDDQTTLSFCNFTWYYDDGLCRDKLTQANGETPFVPVHVLLQNALADNGRRALPLMELQDVTHTFHLSGELTGNTNVINAAIQFLNEQFTNWCKIQNARGSFTDYSIQQSLELSTNGTTSNFNEAAFEEIDGLLQ